MNHIEFEQNEGVCTLTMKTPGVFNVDSLASFNAALDATLDCAEAQVLVITGEGKNFSQGLDLEFIVAMQDPDGAMVFVKNCMSMIGRLLRFPLPVVAALNGHAFGLGAMVTLASDYRVMREDRGYFCLPEADLGMTLTGRMNALVTGKLSAEALRDVLLAGIRVDARRALQLGIVDATGPVDSLVATGIELATPMRGKKREALAGLKRGVNTEILRVIEANDPEATIVD